MRFLTVPGTYNGETFPPGTGNVDAIVPASSAFTGTGATITTTTASDGANEMGGGFALSFGAEVTETLLYTADDTSVEAVIEVSERTMISLGLRYPGASQLTGCIYCLGQVLN